MASRRVFVDVLFLRIVDPHQGLDRLDHALCISNQVSIGIVGCQVRLELSQETRQMDDLAVRSTHRAQAVIVGEKFGEFRIDLGLVLAFMFDNPSRNDLCLPRKSA